MRLCLQPGRSRADTWWVSLNICFIAVDIMSNMTLSTNPGVNGVLYCRQRRTEPPWPQVTCTENFVKFGQAISRYLNGQTDCRHTDIQTRCSQYFALYHSYNIQLCDHRDSWRYQRLRMIQPACHSIARNLQMQMHKVLKFTIITSYCLQHKNIMHYNRAITLHDNSKETTLSWLHMKSD